jgi:hypothetical protein
VLVFVCVLWRGRGFLIREGVCQALWNLCSVLAAVRGREGRVTFPVKNLDLKEALPVPTVVEEREG